MQPIQPSERKCKTGPTQQSRLDSAKQGQTLMNARIEYGQLNVFYVKKDKRPKNSKKAKNINAP